MKNIAKLSIQSFKNIKLYGLLFLFILIFVLFADDLVGLISLLFVISLTIILSKTFPSVSNILLAGLAIRIFTLFLGTIFILPDSGKDAVYFETIGFQWSESGLLNVFNEHYPGANSIFISWIIAILYSIFGRSLLMIQSLSLLFGIGSIFFGWMLAKKIWDNSKANKVGWFLALFPSLVLYSVLTMREVYISFFFLVAIYGIVSWYRTPSIYWIVLAIFGFVAGSFFHGAMSVGALVFIFFICLKNFIQFFKLLITNRINIKNFIITSVMLFVLLLYFTNKIGAPKIGNFQDAIDMSRLTNIMKSSSRGDAAYPDWLQINSIDEFIYKSPIRTIYFMFSPFPWDVRKMSHLIGTMDSILYLTLFYLIFKNRKVIWKEPDLRVIFIILLSYFFVFGIGVGNFGTSIRHRSKFVIGLILLAAPFFPKIVLQKKKN